MANVFQSFWNWLKSLFHSTPTPTPPVTPPVQPPVVTTSLRIAMFNIANAGEANNHGYTSSLEYRACHGRNGEGTLRIAMAQHKKTDGANVLDYIRGGFNKDNPVLDMALCGRKHPQDGHYWDPGTDGETDIAMGFAQHYGLTHHLCWIWNDDGSMPVTAATVKTAVDGYDGTRLGMSNVIFGVCLEANEIMTAAQAAARLADIKTYAPTSPRVVGSCSVDFLKQVAALTDADVFLWVEQDGHPLTAALTKATFPAFLNKCDGLAGAVAGGKARVIPGEYGMAAEADRAWSVEQAAARGYAIVGGGFWQ